MLNGNHFYHAAIRRTISVFGTLFNNISVVKADGAGNVLNIAKVPLAYGPKEKFLARLDQEGSLDADRIAIKLPRMSFEITSLSYEGALKLKRGGVRVRDNASDSNTRNKNIGPTNYRMGIQLSIMTKQQDDALQIVEQIVPYFQPDFNVTIKEVGGEFISDIPFTLTGVTPSVDYEGDFASRQLVVYTLDFETIVHFYGPTTAQGIIKETNVSRGLLLGNDSTPVKAYQEDLVVSPRGAGPSDVHVVDQTWLDDLGLQ